MYPQKQKNLPVFVISNLDESSLLNKIQTIGVSGYIIKADHTPGEFVEVVKGVLDTKVRSNA